MEKLSSVLSLIKSAWEKKDIRLIIAIAAVGLLAIILIVSLFTCNNQRQFVGTWQEIDSDGNFISDGETLVFANDGTGSVKSGGMSGSLTWSVEKDKLFVTVSLCGVADSKVFSYEFSGDKMTLIEADGEKTVYRSK